MRRPRIRRGDRGESLVEILMTVTIVSIAVVAITGALATSVRMSDVHRKQATANAAVRAFAEDLQARVAAAPTAYVDATCATPADYSGLYSPPAGYTATVTRVVFWSDGQFVESCPDNGIQLLTLRVASDDERAVQTLDVVLRKPCRLVAPGVAGCA
jgi:Tfp pilus assembly protein PilV